MVGNPSSDAREGVFTLTSDVDWASEHCIAHFLDLAGDYGVVPTLFVTHASPTLFAAAAAGRCELGIHPNFLPNSSHGATPDDVIRHVLELVPDPVAVRAHAYVDGTAIALALRRHGLRVDSSLCCHLQERLPALRHWAGLLRLPVFFEDDVHWLRGGAWDWATVRPRFLTPGLKVLNFHPFFVALNIPTQEAYERAKPHIPTLDAATAATLRHDGAGCESFLREAIEGVLAAGGTFVTLSRLARTITREELDETI